MTDSELVLWRKTEKYFVKERWKRLEIYNEVAVLKKRTFCIMGQQVNFYSKLMMLRRGGAKAKSHKIKL